MARKIIRTIRHQGMPGEFTPFAPGDIVADDHPLVEHWFIHENSVAWPAGGAQDGKAAAPAPWTPAKIDPPAATLSSAPATQTDQTGAAIEANDNAKGDGAEIGKPAADAPGQEPEPKPVGEAEGTAPATDPEPKTEADKAIEATGESREHLIAQADARGVQIDRRWGVAKLKAALEAAP
jgi:hypothetical protein